MEWNDQFMQLFNDAVERYHRSPQTPVDRFFLPDELKFLESIGCRPGELHRYVMDYAVNGEPSPSTIMLITSVRRSYFLTAQRGISGNAQPVGARDLPTELDEFQEIPYLPRIIRKAETKLYGTLDPSIQYGCAKDREFLREHGDIHPADFLFLTWMVHFDKQRLVSTVLQAMRANGSAPAENAPAPATPERTAQGELNLD